MTSARIANEYVEAVVQVGLSARVANEYVEAVVDPLINLRLANMYVEAVVSTGPLGGWGVGMIRMNV